MESKNYLGGIADFNNQGGDDDDPIVPPSQSQAFRDACIKNGTKYKYFEFEGESHGFRKSQTITTCANEELKFFGEVLGFVPVD